VRPGPCANRVPGNEKECGVRLVVRTWRLHRHNLSSILRPRSTFN
jgi:hypothetical protein